MVENGVFTWTLHFHQQPAHRWAAMIDAGVRPAFVCSQHAARVMIREGCGLIANVSFWAARKYIGNVIYGVAKAAVDKMTADMAHELRRRNAAVVSLYPVWCEQKPCWRLRAPARSIFREPQRGGCDCG